ncbi:hypothetical protein FACS189468_1420 [Spirochaetia bacterium]|nr:hypothetical protein FACS189468_1420 [Spirochaetia bacterium]
MAEKALDLFEAYAENKLPKEEGYIVSSFFNGHTAYSIYEIVSYSGVKSISVTDEGLTFQTNGQKVHILVEPASYPSKGTEPYLRSNTEQIPLRFSDLDEFTAKNQSKIYYSRQPQLSFSSFTILKPLGLNFALVFYNRPDLYQTLQLFFERTLNREAGIPQADSKKAALKIAECVKTNMNFHGKLS